MKAALSRFETSVDHLRKWASATMALHRLVGVEPAKKPKNELEQRHADLRGCLENFGFSRTFNYNGFIVSTYGALERFIEELGIGYLRRIESIIGDYREVPDVIVKSHVALSAKLLDPREMSRRLTTCLRQEVIIDRLHSCFASPCAYRLNAEAFTRHSANFRHDVVNGFFGVMGVKNASTEAKAHEPLKSLLVEDGFPGEKLQNRDDVAFQILNDLVDRRNDVAHGVGGEILSLERFGDYLDFIAAYGKSLFSVLRAELVPIEIKHKGTSLGSAFRIIDNRIICLPLEQGMLRVGDRVAARSPKERYRSGYVNPSVA